MKTKLIKIILVLALGAAILLPGVVWAYTFNDPSNDAIGSRIYESYGIDVFNYTPGAYTGSISFSLFTNFPNTGDTVNGSPPWTTMPADVFITETYKGNQYLWAVPLVSHDGFSAGTMYAVGTFLTSDDMDPSGGSGYIYNHDVPVAIATQGNNYGYGSFGGSAVWNALGTDPDWRIDVVLNGLYQDDPNGIWTFTWGTATCANDVISGVIPDPVPLPSTLLLLGTGLLRLAFPFRRKNHAA